MAFAAQGLAAVQPAACAARIAHRGGGVAVGKGQRETGEDQKTLLGSPPAEGCHAAHWVRGWSAKPCFLAQGFPENPGTSLTALPAAAYPQFLGTGLRTGLWILCSVPGLHWGFLSFARATGLARASSTQSERKRAFPAGPSPKAGEWRPPK